MGGVVVGILKRHDVRCKLTSIRRTRTAQRLQRQNPEPDFNHIQPTGAGRRVVEKNIRMRGKPFLMPLVNAVIVHNHMICHRVGRGKTGKNTLQKGQKPTLVFSDEGVVRE